MNEPPDQTAELSAANLLSVGGMIVEKYWRTRSGCSRTRRVGVGEDHALVAQIFLQRAVDHFALELRLDAGQKFLFGLGNAQPVEGLLDLVGHVVPGFALMIGRLEIVEDVLKIDADIAAPVRHRLGVENLQAFQAKIEHPLGLVLHLRDLPDDIAVQSATGLEDGLRLGAKIVFIDLANGRIVIFRTGRGDNVSSHDNYLRQDARLKPPRGSWKFFPASPLLQRPP